MTEYQTVLVIDSAMSGCGAALFSRKGQVSASEVLAMTRGQAEALMPLVDRVLAKVQARYDDMDAIVATTGPGAFTGLRIGMSAAKSLGLALNIPVYGITTLQALALAYVVKEQPSTPFATIIETKRSDFYYQAFDSNGKKASKSLAIEGDILAEKVEAICIGDALARFQEETNTAIQPIHGYEAPDPVVIAQTFLAENAPSEIFSKPAQPVYLRPADVSVSKKKQRVIESTK